MISVYIDKSKLVSAYPIQQIALCDILEALGIKPDGMIGHSLGELGCAYADGTFTAEQMILAAYYRGLVSLETEFIHGTMSAIGKY